jgi:hypothetical protein
MLSETRYGSHFHVVGDRSVHYGPFPCGPAITTTTTGACCQCASQR